MKQFLKTSILLLLALLLPAAATAYDFEVDGIYYNITGSNSVEVTYSTFGDSYYTEEVVIPNQVSYNSENYTVTAIGDSAFCHYLESPLRVTIPESVSYIGVHAFCSEPLIITFLSETLPTINDSFYSYYHESFPYYYTDINPDWDSFTYHDYKYDYFTVILVPSSGYQLYKELNDNNHYFNWVYCYDWEKTEAPSIDINTCYYDTDVHAECHYPRVKICLIPNEESRVFSRIDTKPGNWWQKGFWGEDSVKWLDYPFGQGSGQGENSFVYGVYSVAEGKLPSDLIRGADGGPTPPYLYYDFEDLGIAYSYINESSVIVKRGQSEEVNGDNYSVIYFNYFGDIIVPSFVNGYNVTGIDHEAFKDCVGLTSLTLPNTITWIGYEALSGCTGLKKLVIPISISSEVECDAESIYLIGEGKRFTNEYNSYSLSKGLKYLYIGSGVTGVQGMKVNPDTIICCATTPPVCDENSFTGYDAELHVPAASLAAYFTAPYWCNFTNIIGDAVGLQSVTLNQDSLNMQPGMSQTLHATLNPAHATSETITWCSTNDNVARVYNGQVTAVAKGECDIIATCLDKQAICHVSVSVLPSEITLDQESIVMGVNSQQTLSVTVLPTDATSHTITWSSTSDNIATVSNNGVVTAIRAGECDIIARCQNLQAVCHVTVFEVAPTALILNMANAQIGLGSQFTLTATVLPENSTENNVSWSSSNNDIASVNDGGVVTAIGAGECDIIATCGDVQAVCHVIVVNTYISLDSHEASVLPNHIIMLTPTVSPVSTDLVVTSSNPAVAAARMAGNKIQVVGVSEGEATIVVNSADGYAFADSCQVRVYTERGDVNGDGFVDIADVSALIDYLLGGDASEVNEVNADTDGNGDVSIADVSMLIDYLLGSTELPPKEEDGMVEYTVNGVTFKMVKVDGGSFTMGATEEEDADYQVFKGSPKHQVTLSKYWIGQTEVTQELWAAVMGSNPSTDQSNLQYPVNSISWEDCATFISQLNQLTGKQFRLPTEAEWEYAAKGGAKSMGYVYSGSDNLNEVAWFSTNSESRLHQVGTKKANELGLYDMCGNIDEWCNDWYSLYTADPVENPTGPETGMSRIHRGGRWNASAMYCRLTRRDGFAPGVTRNYLGLRLALTE